MEGLTQVQDATWIVYNDSLADISALQGLTIIEGSLDISGNPLLTSLSGLDNVTEVRHGLSVVGNDGLVDITALSALTVVDDDLVIEDNDALTTLAGLENLVEIGVAFANGIVSDGSLRIEDNAVLADVTALHGLNSVAWDVVIRDNPMLTDAAANDLVAAIGTIVNNVTVSGNQ